MLHHQFGLELTYHGRFSREARADFEKLVRAHGYPEKDIWRFWMNYDCDSTIEFNSPPLLSLNEICDWYRFAAQIAKQHGWVTHPEKWTSGGGHLHLSPVGDRKAIWLAHCNRPWLNWIFNEPEDDLTAQPIFPAYFNERASSKHSMITLRANTIELRYFEMPKSVREQILHIEFADRWMKAIRPEKPKLKMNRIRCRYGFVDDPHYYIKREYDLSPFTLDKVVADFRSLLKSLDLRFRDYEIFIERNLIPRLTAISD